jgi:hypothetical protein
MEAEEAIALHGGRADLGELARQARTAPADARLRETIESDFESLSGTIELLRRLAPMLARQNGAGEVELVVTRSLSMRCAVRRLDDHRSLVLLPAGLLARVRVMNRLLLSYWDEGLPSRELIGSLWDAKSGRLLVPKKLEPLLTESVAAGQWWRKLAELDAAIELNDVFAPDVQELNHVIVTHVAWHEFGHLLRRHFEISREIEAAVQATHLDATEVRRALECDADAVADYLSVYVLISQASGSQHDPGLGFLRLGYGLTALYALYDPDRRVIADYVGGGYAHPQIRQQMSIENQGGAARTFDLDALYGENAAIGADRCISALTHLELDAIEGRWGATNGAYALHALRAPYQRARRFMQSGMEPAGLTSLVRLARRVREQRQQQQLLTRYISDLYGEPELLPSAT